MAQRRPEIAASWRRCREARLRPEHAVAPVDETALRGARRAGHAREQFLDAATELAAGFVAGIGETAPAIAVCDDFGLVLHRAGSPAALADAARLGLRDGGLWGETTVGTTALAVALATGRPSRVTGDEHFAVALRGSTTAATLVRHPASGEPLGGLLALAARSPAAELIGPLVAGLASDVEQRLRDVVFGRDRELMESYLHGRAGDAIPFLAVDRAGRTVIQNARMLQGASGEDVQVLLSLARRALGSDAELAEELELSRGPAAVRVEIVRGDSEPVGALVALHRLARRPHAPTFPVTLDWSPLVGRSPAMQRLFREAARVARGRIAVAISGEPGTGKLMLAEHLHRLGGGEDPYAIVHCARARWREELEAATARRGTVVLRRVHALSDADQLELCDRLDELADGDAGAWMIALLNPGAAPPSAELLSRLARVSLAVPALRDRGHDLRLLVEHWCGEREFETGSRPVLRPEALEALAAQPWPGNVRELHNALDAAALRGGAVIGLESLHVGAHPPAPPADGSLRELERSAIDTALERTGGNVSAAARELGIGRATLHRRLRAYRLMAAPRSADVP